MKKKAAVAMIMAMFLPAVYGAVQPDSFQKAEVRRIVEEVGRISRGCATVNELGNLTVEQGKRVLALGPAAVYALSNCLDDRDWKVRFWIADMLGYLENPDARRPLMRRIKDPFEKKAVKLRAIESIKRLELPLEHEAETVEDKGMQGWGLTGR